MFKELKETLYSTLERLYSVTKKEKGLTLNVEDAKVKSKFNMTNMIPVCKNKRNISRVGEKYEKSKATADIVIKGLQKMLKKQFPDANGLQDPQLGQLLNYQIYQNTPFFQVVHNGLYHWLALIT